MKFIYGRNPVFELIKSNSEVISKILIAGENIPEIIDIAKERKLKIEYTNKKKLDFITGRSVHQGILAFVLEEQSYDLESLLGIPEEKKEKAFFVILDSIFDPQNLGGIIRTSESAGVHGIIIPKHRSCRVTPAVVKASSGATCYIPVVEVANISNCIEMLKEKGILVIGLDIDSKEEYLNIDLNRSVAIVVGNEAEGLRRLTKEKCDLLVKISMKGKIGSLNVSVAAGILIYEVLRKQKNKN